MTDFLEIDIQVENGAELIATLAGFAGQIPYATALALNSTGNSAQRAVRAVLPTEFTLRRPDFIERTIYIGPDDRATKDRLACTVRVHPQRDVLAKFEEGGEKKSTSGKSLAVPVFRENAPMLIIRKGDPLSVRKLFESIEKRKGRVFKGRRKQKDGTAPINYGRVFLVHNASGTFILERQRPGPQGNRVLYWFRKSVPIEDRLHFVATARDAALASWDENFGAALDRAIATMR
ncbi:MAG TPA: hypothetical protein VIP11_12195 [Gemmatimonadaceae bacterium]